jgi:hypothetical protein
MHIINYPHVTPRPHSESFCALFASVMVTFENMCTRQLSHTYTALGLLIMLYKGQTIKDRITMPGVLFPVPKVLLPRQDENLELIYIKA